MIVMIVGTDKIGIKGSRDPGIGNWVSIRGKKKKKKKFNEMFFLKPLAYGLSDAFFFFAASPPYGDLRE